MRRRKSRTYRIDFALIVLTGNLTRYLNLRPVVDRDPSVEPRWYPIRTWEENDWLRFLPGGIRLRARHFLDSWKLFVRRPGDAVVIHALETYSLYGVWHWLLRLKTVIVCNSDAAFDPHGRISVWMLNKAVDETSLFVPFSNFTADNIRRTHPAIADRIRVLHPGLPTDRWPQRQQLPRATRFRVLFVAGNAVLKGIDTVLLAFDRSLHDTCDLVVATQRVFLPPELEEQMRSDPWVELHLDLTPGSAELQELYRNADAFVQPSRADMSSWVALEAMATGIPVVITGVGGIPDIVRHDETGLVIEPDNVEDLITAVRRLEASPELAARLVEAGRRHVVEQFDVETNTNRLLEMTKDLVAERDGLSRRLAHR